MNHLLTREQIVRRIRHDAEKIGLREGLAGIDDQFIKYGDCDVRYADHYDQGVSSLSLSEDQFSERLIAPLLASFCANHNILMPMPPRNPEQVRGETHGDYSHNAATAQTIKRALTSSVNWGSLSATQKESLDLIATKMARIVTGDPNCHDHWDDIAGYARLARDRIAQKKD